MTDTTDSTTKSDKITNSKPSSSSSRSGRRRGRGRGGNKNWSIDQFVVEPQEGKVRFHDFDIPLPLMRGIHGAGFSYCTPIQGASLPHTLRCHDMVGKAQTGTGKTAAFLVSTISDLLKHQIEDERYMGEARALILAPTRELAIQIADDAEQLVKHTDLNVHCLVGGMDYAKQLQKIQKKHCDILVGTPGRLLDFANNRDIHLDQVEVLVIDEADRMLDMGFIPQVRRLVRLTPPREDRQTLLFSATFTPEVLRLSEQWTDKPVMLEMEPERVATDTVEQKIFITTANEKFNLLQNILNDDAVESVMVFANRRDVCRTLYERLKKQGFKVGLIAGDVPQNRRMKTLESFKNGSLKVMVATDVAGRGIHVNGVSHVVNYTLPEEPEDYVHRIGRTGRAGQTGISVSFACEDDAFLLEPIEKLLDMKLPCTMPDEALLADVPAPARKPSAAKKSASKKKSVEKEAAQKEASDDQEIKQKPSVKAVPVVEAQPVGEKPAEEQPAVEELANDETAEAEPKKEKPKTEEAPREEATESEPAVKEAPVAEVPTEETSQASSDDRKEAAE